MACFYPISVEHVTTRSGRSFISFHPLNDTELKVKSVVRTKSIQIPCNKCLGCRLEHARMWSVRCMHEAKYHKDSCFITLTYDNEHLPKGGSLVKDDLLVFIKSIRNHYGSGIRYFACGEYGSKKSRPHYHILLFGLTFGDAVRYSKGRKNPVYTSATLGKFWTKGLSVFGRVTHESSAYVARYTAKKSNSLADYNGKEPEYITMSRRGGIGYRWIADNFKDVYAIDKIIIDTKIKCKPPRFYDKFLQKVDAGLYEEVKERRLLSLNLDSPELIDERLRVREKIQFRRFCRLTRELEQGGSDFSDSDMYYRWSDHDVDYDRIAQDELFYSEFKSLNFSEWSSIYEDSAFFYSN